ncbi:nucleotidyltransferase [archaeon]|nr:nucleotidyltransferase [archaeon]
MPYDIIVGRNESDRKKFGKKGVVLLGKSYVRMGQTTSLSNKILLDIAKSHVILISGKRGSGKSYSLSVIAEEMVKLPKEVSKNLSVLILDTMGIFWTMKYPNERQKDLLGNWNLKPEPLDVDIYTPSGFYEEHKKKGIPTDFSFSIKTSELNAGDWCNTFEIKLTDPIGILLERILEDLKGDYSIKDIIAAIKKDKRSDKQTKDAAENRFMAAKAWGLFDSKGTEIKDIIKSGKISILDVSCYTHIAGSWSIKGLVIGLIGRKLLIERITARKAEEVKAIKEGTRFFTQEEEKKEKKTPLVWMMIDEAHELLPKVGKTPATDALIQLLREGRQPGISLILATQQPGEIHRDVMTQSDLVISHRITAKPDIEALNGMMQTYLISDLQKYLNDLPRLKGSAIILDDNSERIYPMRVRPKISWHGGEAPSSVKIEKKLEL